jgi:hypothetical protein
MGVCLIISVSLEGGSEIMSRSWIAGFIVLCLMAFVPCAAALEEDQPPDSQTESGDQANDGDQQDRDSEIPLTAGYEKNSTNGVFIRSKDEQFRLNIGLYTQFRYDINWRDAPAGEDDVERGFSVNRTRIFFEGQYTPKFDYHFRLNIDDEGDFSLLVAYLQYNIGEKWHVRFGRQFVALSREDWMLPQDTLTTEFSPNDFTFAPGASAAVQANYQAESTRLWLSVNDGAYGAKKDFPNNETTDVALTGRWEYQIAGRDWSVWDDLVGRRGRPRGVLLGLAGGYQVEEDASAFDRSAQLNADISFNGDGYHAMVAGSWTWRDPVAADSFSNYGLLVQGGYFVAKHWQVYGQYNFISPGDQAGTPTCSPPQCDPESFNSITGGVSYFPFLWTNRWKFSAEVGHLFDALNKTIVEPSGSLGWLASDEAGQTYFRIQAQFGF